MAFSNNSIDPLNDSLYTPTLDDLEQQQLEKDSHAIVILAMLSVVGSIGNIHTLLVYSVSPVIAKLSVRVFILWLSATDLVACVACVPFEIFDIRYSFTFSSSGACKFFRFLNHLVTLVSGGLLAAIAFERYRRCIKRLPLVHSRPFLKHNIICGIAVGVAVLLSIPALVFYGLNKKETGINGTEGSDCTVLSEFQNIHTAMAYAGVIVLLSSACFIVCVVSYSKILYMIFTQMKKRDKRHNTYQIDIDSSFANTTFQVTTETSVNDVSKTPPPAKQTTDNKPNKTGKGSKGKCPSRTGYDKGKDLTISLIVATGISYFGYIIYVVVIIIKVTNKELYKNSIRPAAAFLLRAYFINNAVNPIVFCVLDPTFRSECIKLYRKVHKRRDSAPVSETPAFY